MNRRLTASLILTPIVVGAMLYAPVIFAAPSTPGLPDTYPAVGELQQVSVDIPDGISLSKAARAEKNLIPIVWKLEQDDLQGNLVDVLPIDSKGTVIYTGGLKVDGQNFSSATATRGNLRGVLDLNGVKAGRHVVTCYTYYGLPNNSGGFTPVTETRSVRINLIWTK